jgi:hypothetical protein
LKPVIGSIINLKSQIAPHFSNNGISSSSNTSLGILPQNTLKKSTISDLASARHFRH